MTVKQSDDERLEGFAYCGQLTYEDEGSHHIKPHPKMFEAECADCSSRLALLRRAAISPSPKVTK